MSSLGDFFSSCADDVGGDSAVKMPPPAARVVFHPSRMETPSVTPIGPALSPVLPVWSNQRPTPDADSDGVARQPFRATGLTYRHDAPLLVSTSVGATASPSATASVCKSRMAVPQLTRKSAAVKPHHGAAAAQRTLVPSHRAPLPMLSRAAMLSDLATGVSTVVEEAANFAATTSSEPRRALPSWCRVGERLALRCAEEGAARVGVDSRTPPEPGPGRAEGRTSEPLPQPLRMPPAHATRRAEAQWQAFRSDVNAQVDQTWIFAFGVTPASLRPVRLPPPAPVMLAPVQELEARCDRLAPLVDSALTLTAARVLGQGRALRQQEFRTAMASRTERIQRLDALSGAFSYDDFLAIHMAFRKCSAGRDWLRPPAAHHGAEHDPQPGHGPGGAASVAAVSTTQRRLSHARERRMSYAPPDMCVGPPAPREASVEGIITPEKPLPPPWSFGGVTVDAFAARCMPKQLNGRISVYDIVKLLHPRNKAERLEQLVADYERRRIAETEPPSALKCEAVLSTMVLNDLAAVFALADPKRRGYLTQEDFVAFASAQSAAMTRAEAASVFRRFSRLIDPSGVAALARASDLDATDQSPAGRRSPGRKFTKPPPLEYVRSPGHPMPERRDSVAFLDKRQWSSASSVERQGRTSDQPTAVIDEANHQEDHTAAVTGSPRRRSSVVFALGVNAGAAESTAAAAEEDGRRGSIGSRRASYSHAALEALLPAAVHAGVPVLAMDFEAFALAASDHDSGDPRHPSSYGP